MRYVAFLHDDDEPGFGISFPDFPGCVSDGDTVDDALRRGAEALSVHVEGMLADGEPIPQPRPLQGHQGGREPRRMARRGDHRVGPAHPRQGLTAPHQRVSGLRPAARHRRRGEAARDDPLGISLQRRPQRDRGAVSLIEGLGDHRVTHCLPSRWKAASGSGDRGCRRTHRFRRGRIEDAEDHGREAGLGTAP